MNRLCFIFGVQYTKEMPYLCKMKCLFSLGYLALLFLLLAGCQKPQPDPKPEPEPYIPVYDDIFRIDALPEIKVTVSSKDWNQFLSYYDQNPHNEECVPAYFSFKDDSLSFEMDSVGFRLGGNTSRRRPEGVEGSTHSSTSADWHHASFRVKFREYVKDTSFWGADRIVLKWFKDDAAYCREIYCYQLFRSFGVWTAPRASYVRLSIHVRGDAKPAYFGVYELIEGVNDAYLETRVAEGHFLSDKGNLWKGSYGADLSNISDSQMGVEVITLDPKTSKGYVYDLKTNKKKGIAAAKEQLTSFVADLGKYSAGSAELKTFLESRMDVDLFLKTYAVNVMVGMWDDYWVNTNNFYFYFDADGKFYFIPYDYDNTLGTSLMINSGTQNPLQWGPRDSSRQLIYKVLSIKEYETKYVEHLRTLASASSPNFFYTDWSISRIKKWHSMISPYVSNDTGEDMSISDVPASWGNASYYRILTGDKKTNFFKSKIESLL